MLARAKSARYAWCVEMIAWPPRDLRRAATQFFRASTVIQIVKSPRFRRLSLYAHQLAPRYCFFANVSVEFMWH